MKQTYIYITANPISTHYKECFALWEKFLPHDAKEVVRFLVTPSLFIFYQSKNFSHLLNNNHHIPNFNPKGIHQMKISFKFIQKENGVNTFYGTEEYVEIPFGLEKFNFYDAKRPQRLLCDLMRRNDNSTLNGKTLTERLTRKKFFQKNKILPETTYHIYLEAGHNVLKSSPNKTVEESIYNPELNMLFSSEEEMKAYIEERKRLEAGKLSLVNEEGALSEVSNQEGQLSLEDKVK